MIKYPWLMGYLRLGGQEKDFAERVISKLKPNRLCGISHGSIYGETVRHTGKPEGRESKAHLQARNLTRVARHRPLCVWVAIWGLAL